MPCEVDMNHWDNLSDNRSFGLAGQRICYNVIIWVCINKCIRYIFSSMTSMICSTY